MALTPGGRLGPYVIVGRIGAGGMGEVYRAHDERLGRDVAVKVLPAAFAADPTALIRFAREARSVAAISHANVVAIYDVGTGPIPYVVTELLEGQTLGERLGAEQSSRVPWREAAEIGVAIADGLSAAHAAGIVHRDVKPGNIFLTRTGQVKILDFGLAQSRPAAGVPPDTQAGTKDILTTPGAILGTLGYMAPEQVRGIPAMASADVFSLGCVLYEMVTGSCPFRVDSPADTIAATLKDDPQRASSCEPGIPGDMDDVIHECLNKDAHQRPSATAVSRGLKDIRILEGAAARAGWPGLDHVAVLPFVSEAGDDALAYLSDGIPETLINTLGRLPGVRVVARSVAFQYRGSEGDPRKVGRALGCKAVVTGSISLRSDLLTIGIELVEAATGCRIWGNVYRREVREVLSITDEITGEIVERLRVDLSGRDRERLAKRYTQDAEAYRSYLRGRHHWNKRTGEGFRKAIEQFSLAIDRDPTYALAYSGLADAYSQLSFFGVIPPRVGYGRAAAAAAKALDLDDTLGEAHASHGNTLSHHAWDLAAAEQALTRAVELSPRYATARHWRAMNRVAAGHVDQAYEEIKRGLELDPLALPISSSLGWISYFAGRFEEAAAQLRATLELDSHYFPARCLLAMAHGQLGRYREAVTEAETARDHSGGSALAAGVVGWCYAIAGRGADSKRVLSELRDLSTDGYVPPFASALVLAGLGDVEGALGCLDTAYEERFGWLIYLNADPVWASLRNHSRFRALSRRIGLIDGQSR